MAGVLRLDDQRAVGGHPLRGRPREGERALPGAKIGRAQQLVRSHERGEPERGRTEEAQGTPRADHDVGGGRRRSLGLAAGAPRRFGIPPCDARIRKPSAHRVLDALGPPAERREPPSVTRRARVGQRLRGAAEPADQPSRGARVRERDRARGTADDGPALVACERGREPAHHEKHAPPRGQGLADRARQRRRERLAPEDAARVGDAHGRPRARLARGHVDEPRLGAPPRLGTGRGGCEPERERLPGRALERHVARVHARRAGRLVSGFVLVEQHQSGGRRKGGEQCRARPDGQTRRSVAQRAPGRRALLVRHPRVEPHDAVDLREPLRPLCDGLDVGGDHQRGPLRRLQPLEQPLLTAGADQELGLGRGERARAAGGCWDSAGVRAPRRRQERGAGRPH